MMILMVDTHSLESDQEKNDIFSVAPKQGKLICFPASWYFHHRGDVVTRGSKYICTG